jgi:uncharacterized protein YndB with AHSA1/START domain
VKLDLVCEGMFPHPPEDVWRALTDSAVISDWLMPTTDFRAAVGATFRLKTQHLSPTGWIEADVTELEPPRWMVWAWSMGDGTAPTAVSFELTPEAGGTRLRLPHVGEIDPFIGGLLTEGWPSRIELLRRSLD